MKCRFVEEEIPYTGRELTSHWIYRRFDLLGDSMVSFVGPCHVTVDGMADLVDVKAHAPIYSEQMLHFIAEHFACDLEKAVLRQRLLICIISEVMVPMIQGRSIRRLGDDLYEGENKLSVSIAVKSPVSSLIHVGLNVKSHGTPVKTIGLNDLSVNAESLANAAMDRYREELKGIAEAQCKVRGVP